MTRIRQALARLLFHIGAVLYGGDVYIVTPVGAQEAARYWEALVGELDDGDDAPCGPDCLCTIRETPEGVTFDIRDNDATEGTNG